MTQSKIIPVVAALVLAATLTLSAAPNTPMTDRVIDRDIQLRFPLLPCAVPSAALAVGRFVSGPVGVEYVPERCTLNQLHASGLRTCPALGPR